MQVLAVSMCCLDHSNGFARKIQRLAKKERMERSVLLLHCQFTLFSSIESEIPQSYSIERLDGYCGIMMAHQTNLGSISNPLVPHSLGGDISSRLNQLFLFIFKSLKKKKKKTFQFKALLGLVIRRCIH